MREYDFFRKVSLLVDDYNIIELNIIMDIVITKHSNNFAILSIIFHNLSEIRISKESENTDFIKYSKLYDEIYKIYTCNDLV